MAAAPFRWRSVLPRCGNRYFTSWALHCTGCRAACADSKDLS